MLRWGGLHRAALAVALVAMVTSGLIRIGTTPVSAAVGDVGWSGGSYVGSGADPTGPKPESKLWWNDGFWWASMYDRPRPTSPSTGSIVNAKTWVDTGVGIDDRAGQPRRRPVGRHPPLRRLAHLLDRVPPRGNPARLYRYSYDSRTKTYALDGGFPVSINDYRTETLVIDKDSHGVAVGDLDPGQQGLGQPHDGATRRGATPFVPR